MTTRLDVCGSTIVESATMLESNFIEVFSMASIAVRKKSVVESCESYPQFAYTCYRSQLAAYRPITRLP